MSCKQLLGLLALFLLMTSCYRMPEDDEFSVVPTTNNRSLTSEKSSLVPGVSY